MNDIQTTEDTTEKPWTWWSPNYIFKIQSKHIAKLLLWSMYADSHENVPYETNATKMREHIPYELILI